MVFAASPLGSWPVVYWGPQGTSQCPWGEATSPGGGKAGSTVTRDSTPTRFSSPQSVDDPSSCQGDSNNREGHRSRGVFKAYEQTHSLGCSLSAFKEMLLLSSLCSSVWDPRRLMSVSQSAHPSLPPASAHLHLHVKITFLGSQTDVCMC